MRPYILIFGLLWACPLFILAQGVEQSTLTWWQYKGRFALNSGMSLSMDLQHRRQSLIKRSSQQVIRPGLSLHLKNELILTAGTAFFWHSLDEKTTAYRFEFRPYVFSEWKQPLGRVMVTHRSRFELRYNRKTEGLESLHGFNFNYRAGHRMGLLIPVFQSRNHQLEIYDEVLVNFGKRIRVNHLDQNRIFVGLRKKVSGQLSVKLGYMYVFLPTGSAEMNAAQHIIVFSLATR